MAIRQSLRSPARAKTPVGRPPQGTTTSRTATAAVRSDDVVALKKQLEIQQQALDTQAWMIQEISDLRQQLAQRSTLGGRDDMALRQEIAALRQENVALQEKANRLQQMAALMNSTVGTRELEPVTAPPRGPKAGAAMGGTVPSSLWQAVADADLNRTYKSCWPVVFKIEEWNQRNPSKMAKISQTMLNKSGVNFSRAREFVDTYAVELQQYHNQIGLTKANSGKFNEVYDFVRTSLGKGRRG